MDGESLTRVNLAPARSAYMRGEKGVICGEKWRDPASLVTSRIRMELCRAGGKSSWGGGKSGVSPAGVLGQADCFKIGHFRCGVCGGARDCSFEEGDSRNRVGPAIPKTPIGLKNDSWASDGDIVRSWRNSNICAY